MELRMTMSSWEGMTPSDDLGGTLFRIPQWRHKDSHRFAPWAHRPCAFASLLLRGLEAGQSLAQLRHLAAQEIQLQSQVRYLAPERLDFAAPLRGFPG